MAKITTPIWEDIYVAIGGGYAKNFRVRVNSSSGDIIYAGRAMPAPGSGTVTVKLNDIFADYFTHTVPTLGAASFSALTFPLLFYVQVEYSAGVWTTLSDYYEVLMNWSYDPAYVLGSTLSAPVRALLSADQYVFVTVYNVASVTAVFTFDDGSTDTETISLAVDPDFDASFNHDFSRSVRSAGSGTAVFKISNYTPSGKKTVSVTINGETFDVANDCDWRYTLYYLNAYGGWDSLVMTGNALRADYMTRNTMEMSYDNRGVMNRGRKDYAIDIKRKYTLRTGILTDDESSRMWHLLESTDVYMHDLLTGEVRPVVLTDSEAVHQTFKGNGGSFANYTLQAEIAQVFERR